MKNIWTIVSMSFSLSKKNISILLIPLLVILMGGYFFFGTTAKKPVLLPLSPNESLAAALSNYGNYDIREGNYDPKLEYILALNKISSDGFPEKVVEICEKLDDTSSQNCYSFSGAKLFLDNPKEPATGLEYCDKLPRGEGKAGKNRTPANFCGSGLWGEFFNNVNTADLIKQLKPTAEQVFALCAAQNNFSNLTCYQEFGKYAMINKATATDSELYEICYSATEPSFKDQCQSGAGRGVSLKSSGNYLQLNIRCSSLKKDYYTTKCFNSIGMDSSKEDMDAALDFCSSPLNTIGVSCYYNYGKIAFGYHHGSIPLSIEICDSLSKLNADFGFWCTLGMTNSVVNASLLYTTLSDISEVPGLCNGSATINTPIVGVCKSNFFMNSAIESLIPTPQKSIEFCGKDKQCYWSLGFSAKDEALELESFCPSSYLNECKKGYIRELLKQ